MSRAAEREQVISLRVTSDGIVRPCRAEGLRIAAPPAREAVAADAPNVALHRPLLVDISGTATLSREARMVVTEKCSASMTAPVGRSAADSVIVNVAPGVSTPRVPTRFHTSDPAAPAWLRHGDTRT